jgi:hypothetical protein
MECLSHLREPARFDYFELDGLDFKQLSKNDHILRIDAVLKQMIVG